MSIEEDKNNYDTHFRDSGWNKNKQNTFSDLVIRALIEIRDRIPTNPTLTTPFEKPTPEDVKKIHDEINQIVNQRFLVTTLAITSFGVIGAWIVRENLGGTLIFAVSLLLSSLICMLSFFNHSLKKTLRIFTTYLIASESTMWENHWMMYRGADPNKITRVYTKTQTKIFITLGFFSLILPIAITIVNNLGNLDFLLKPSSPLIYIGLVVFFIINSIFLFIEYHLGYRIPDNDNELIEKWNRIIKKRTNRS